MTEAVNQIFGKVLKDGFPPPYKATANWSGDAVCLHHSLVYTS